MTEKTQTKNSLILVTGGSRSGKSAFAQQYAERSTGPRLFIATCPCTDKEMADRIRLHQQARTDKGWLTVEEQMQPAAAINNAGDGTCILLDCLTLWINNLLFKSREQGKLLTEEEMISLADRLADAAKNHRGTVIMVTGEVGQGIVPENALARRYRDLVGRCNQCVARRADHVFLVSCGIALRLK